jgi:hypothetical protein
LGLRVKLLTLSLESLIFVNSRVSISEDSRESSEFPLDWIPGITIPGKLEGACVLLLFSGEISGVLVVLAGDVVSMYGCDRTAQVGFDLRTFEGVGMGGRGIFGGGEMGDIESGEMSTMGEIAGGVPSKTVS